MGFRVEGRPKIRGTCLGVPYNKDESIWHSILKTPYFGKRPLVPEAESGNSGGALGSNSENSRFSGVAPLNSILLTQGSEALQPNAQIPNAKRLKNRNLKHLTPRPETTPHFFRKRLQANALRKHIFVHLGGVTSESSGRF